MSVQGQNSSARCIVKSHSNLCLKFSPAQANVQSLRQLLFLDTLAPSADGVHW